MPNRSFATDGLVFFVMSITPRHASSRALVVILAFHACAMLIGLGGGSLSHTDEYRTAERSREFLVTGDWTTVHDNFAPRFNKPPLQYWLTALTIPWTEDREWPVRVWSALGSVAAVAAVAWLAATVAGAGSWAVPLAALFCLLDGGFSVAGRSALLDAWMMAFNTAAVAAALAARAERRWWWAAAACVAAGAWQKAPIALALVAVVCVARIAEGDRRFLRCPTFHLAMAGGLALTFSWPVWQWTLHGTEFLQVQYLDEMVRRSGALTEKPARFHPWIYFTLLWDSWHLLWPAALGGLVCIPFTPLRRNRPLVVVAVLAAALLAILSGLSFRSHRYAAYVVPMFSVVAAVALTHVLAGRRLLVAVVLLTLPGLSAFPQVYDARNRDKRPDLKRAASDLGAAYRPGERPLLVRAAKSDLRTDAMLFYGELPTAVLTVDAGRIERAFARLEQPRAGFRGLTDRSCWPLIVAHFPEATRQAEFGPYVHWWAPRRDPSATSAGRSCRAEDP
ncbi:MAG: glycosyltransferase family 39 protein [Candidatus Eiseniibacteriota bacterium]|jgi:4-amino-4-deoxy-L-arabinose transferase-like glycosyltransferase